MIVVVNEVLRWLLIASLLRQQLHFVGWTKELGAWTKD
jgi:hypothetical protein